jgi:hypothetical protein
MVVGLEADWKIDTLPVPSAKTLVLELLERNPRQLKGKLFRFKVPLVNVKVLTPPPVLRFSEPANCKVPPGPSITMAQFMGFKLLVTTAVPEVLAHVMVPVELQPPPTVGIVKLPYMVIARVPDGIELEPIKLNERNTEPPIATIEPENPPVTLTFNEAASGVPTIVIVLVKPLPAPPVTFTVGVPDTLNPVPPFGMFITVAMVVVFKFKEPVPKAKERVAVPLDAKIVAVRVKPLRSHVPDVTKNPLILVVVAALASWVVPPTPDLPNTPVNILPAERNTAVPEVLLKVTFPL